MSDCGPAHRAVVVCDLDDTLYLERDYVLSGFKSLDVHISEKFGISDFSAAAWGLFLAGNRNDIFNRVLAARDCQFNPADILEMVRLYRHHVPQITLLPDVVQFLGQVAENVALALVTDGPVAAQSAKIRALGLQSRFAPIYMTDQWGISFRKPHPRAFHSIIQRYNRLQPAQFVYVADNPKKDFQAPHTLGWWTIRIRRQMGLHFDVPSDHPAHIGREISNFSEIMIENLSRSQCP